MSARADAQRVPPSSFLQRLEQARNLKEREEYLPAIRLLEEILSEDPGSSAVLEEIAENEWRVGHARRAFVAARRTVTLHSESAMGHCILGLIAIHEGGWGKAVESLRCANRLRPDTPDILRGLGWALFHAGEAVQGVATLERALNLEEENTQTLCDLGEVYAILRAFPKARSLFLRVLEIDPEHVRAKDSLQRLLHQERSGPVVVEHSAIV